MDRLQQTLTQRIEEWKALIDAAVGGDEKTRKKLWIEQLTIALDIASALEYLHGQGYIFRDLKPDNVGLDSEGRGKLFDFGLARKMPTGSGQFQMSGQVGTCRYMAPEVYKCRDYNAKADVYSFSHLLWEMLALEKPYQGYTKQMHKKRIVRKGLRPELDPSWPLGIQKLLEWSWHRDMAERPSMAEIRAALEAEIADLVAGRRYEEPTSKRLSLVGSAATEEKTKGRILRIARRLSGQGHLTPRAA
mmetsp:Transcript_5007/g.11236  ORF Transcript_5007/g.11236 Transcript_5007/m.11236 type:complete len:247 (-) Transcript_5007:126-866(-)